MRCTSDGQGPIPSGTGGTRNDRGASGVTSRCVTQTMVSFAGRPLDGQRWVTSTICSLDGVATVRYDNSVTLGVHGGTNHTFCVAAPMPSATSRRNRPSLSFATIGMLRPTPRLLVPVGRVRRPAWAVRHVIWIVMEISYNQVILISSAPYENQACGHCGLATTQVDDASVFAE